MCIKSELQFTCSIKWGGIVLNDCEMLCWWQFAFHAIRNCLYCCKWDLQSVLLNTISNYADSGAIRAHVSKLVGGVFHWVVDWLFYPILWKPLRRIHSRQNLYSNYRLTEFVFNSFPLIGPSCVSSRYRKREDRSCCLVCLEYFNKSVISRLNKYFKITDLILKMKGRSNSK